MHLLLRSAVLAACFAAACLAQEASSWTPLFDGKSLKAWKPTPFKGAGEALVEDGAIVLRNGKPMTGVTYTGDVPKSGYEIRFEAARKLGSDFFATLTFPVGDSFCSFVTGGWGGDIIGLSNIDGWDASENETRAYFTFENDRWYVFRLEVNPDRIRVWIDEEKVIDAKIGGREISLRRGEIKLSAPLGFASYGTVGAIRKVEYRLLRSR